MSSVGVERFRNRAGRRRTSLGMRGAVIAIASCAAFAAAFAVGHATSDRGAAQAEASSTLAVVAGRGVIPVRLDSAPPIAVPVVARPSSQPTPPAPAPQAPATPEATLAPVSPAQPTAPAAPAAPAAPVQQQPSPSAGPPSSGGGSSTKAGGGTFDSSG